jgi:hypothetical protein
MVICKGLGDCIKQCYCVCYDDEDEEIPSKECICGHRHHAKLYGGILRTDIYCKQECEYKCQLIECPNFKLCGKKYPQWYLNCYKGLCINCRVCYGKIKFLDQKDECSICFETKEMIKINCGKHKFCLECWTTWADTTIKYPVACPFCREGIY